MSSPSARRQSGAVLAVALLLLMALTVLALGASQATRGQERIAASLHRRDLAFQAAEATLRGAERLLVDSADFGALLTCATRCRIYPRGLDPQAPYQSGNWWESNAWAYTSADEWIPARAPRQSGGSNDPAGSFFVEFFDEVPDSLAIAPDGPPAGTIYVRVTAAAAAGGSDSAPVVLQSTLARRAP
jgi:type IV pilus assembly protein PilX